MANMRGLFANYGKFLLTSSVVGCISILVIIIVRHLLKDSGMPAEQVVLAANSIAYCLGTLLSYFLQVRFVHHDTHFSRWGITLFFAGQFALSILLGALSAKLEVAFIAWPSLGPIVGPGAALVCALLLVAPISYLIGRYCTRIR